MMKTRNNSAVVAMAVICLCALSMASEPSAPRGETKAAGEAVTTDAIFDEIMQSLPNQVRAEVDSASVVKAQGSAAGSGQDGVQAVVPKAGEEAGVPAAALEELPENVRAQVEKAIQEMDNRALQRRLEFMEQKRNRSK